MVIRRGCAARKSRCQRAFPHHEAAAIIQADSGSAFDPHIDDCFLDDTEAFNAVACKFRDWRG